MNKLKKWYWYEFMESVEAVKTSMVGRICGKGRFKKG